MQKTGTTNLKFVDLENNSNETELNLSEGKMISLSLIKELVKLILTEKVWGKLVANTQYILDMITTCVFWEKALRMILSRN